MIHLLFGKDSDSFCYRVVLSKSIYRHSPYRAIYAEIVPQQKGDKLCERVYKISFSEKVVTRRQTRPKYPDRADNPYFSPLPLFRWETEFFTYYLIGFHLIQAVPICVQNADTAKDY